MKQGFRGNRVRRWITGRNRWGKFWLGAIAALLLSLALSPALAHSPQFQPDPEKSVSQAQATPDDLVRRGKDLYDSGRYGQAANILEQAAQGFRSQGELLQQAATLANVSLAYQQLGAWERATEAITESLRLLEPAGQAVAHLSPPHLKLLAQALEIQGRLHLIKGEAEAALATWNRSEALYRQAGEEGGIIKSRLNQAQALRSLGFYRRALLHLQELTRTLQPQPDSRQKAVTLRALGDALQLVGDLEQADKTLNQSLEVAQRLQLPAETGATLLSLGNTARARQQIQAAIAYYTQSASKATTPLANAQAQLNLLSVFIDTQQWEAVQRLLPQLPPLLKPLPPTRAAVYAQIHFAQALLKVGSHARDGVPPALSGTSPFPPISSPGNLSQGLQETLSQAIGQARELGDQRAESYALGTLGAVYEQTGQRDAAQQVTQKALALAQSTNTWDIAYRWQWQLGRLFRQKGQIGEAIAAYDAAIANLKSLRGDLAAVSPDVQFNFRDSVEPIYRQSVELLLQSQAGKPDGETLEKARQRIEALQLAELDNFFREACLEGQRVLLDQVVDREHPNTSVLYPIVLRDRGQKSVSLQVIAKIPNQPLKRYATRIPEAEFDNTLAELQLALAKIPNAANLATLRSRAKTLYGWLIEPLDRELQAIANAPKPTSQQAITATPTNVDTLVFVLDDALRNIPMALLWDGQQYLVEKYGIALSVGLQLFDPKPIKREPLKVLAAGLSQPPQGSPREFGELRYVQSEIESIARSGLPTTELLNQAFTRQALESQINAAPFNVVHLATHGKFSSKAEDTYILAANGPINVTEFDHLLRSRGTARPEPIQLLVLSACQTATNDNRATLGLAGFAVRAGARSTLASLRNASDESTPLLITEFYKELNHPKENVSKAEALRRAQMALLQDPNYRNYRAPQYWAAYVLIGNWL